MTQMSSLPENRRSP